LQDVPPAFADLDDADVTVAAGCMPLSQIKKTLEKDQVKNSRELFCCR